MENSERDRPKDKNFGKIREKHVNELTEDELIERSGHRLLQRLMGRARSFFSANTQEPSPTHEKVRRA